MTDSQSKPLADRFQQARIKMRDLGFQAHYYHYFLIAIIVLCILCMCVSAVLYYQIWHRPIPLFYAVNPEQKRFELIPYEEPNFLPDTLIRWASKAVVASYTYDIANYKAQMENARQYFTQAGWESYSATAEKLIQDIRRKQISVNGVVSGTPVISNQGPMKDMEYAWVVQLPFLVTYQTSNSIVDRNFIVVLTIVKVPTSVDPRGMGIQEFVMRSVS